MSFASLLPSNYGALDINLEQVSAIRLHDVDIPVSTVWSSADCPLEFLPFLAWSLSVDYWNPEWPEQKKRDVIAATPGLHSIKGTKAAVVGALESLGLSVDYQAWYEQEPVAPRGTVNINVDANELDNNPPLNFNDYQNQITAMINANKRGSIHHSVVLCFESLMQRHLGFSEFNSDSMTITVTQ